MRMISSSSRGRSRGAWRRLWPLAPAIGWLIVFCCLPLLLIAMYSLGTRTEGGGVALTLTLENYQRFFESRFYLAVTRRSLWIGFVVTVATLAVAYPVAYFLATTTPRRRNILMVLLVIPWWCSILVKNFAWIALLSETGAVNTALIQLGLIRQPLQLVYTETAVVIGLMHVLVPFMVLPIFATLDRLDPRLPEAAASLGCGPIRSFVEVTLPLSLPGVAAGSILTFVLAFGSFITPALLGGERTVMVANIIEDQFMQAFHWPFGSAIAVVLLVLVLAILVVFDRLVGLEKIWGADR
jgi:spermidine/putrescine transport system permease protein